MDEYGGREDDARASRVRMIFLICVGVDGCCCSLCAFLFCNKLVARVCVTQRVAVGVATAACVVGKVSWCSSRTKMV